MRTIKKDENDEHLRMALRKWEVNIILPSHFQEQVWKRISREESKASNFWPMFSHWVEKVFSRPALALSYAAILLLIGLTAGFLRAQDRSAAVRAQWRAAYVQSVDPYQVPREAK